MKTSDTHSGLKAALLLLGLSAAAISATGCQVSVGGQTLPSPYYMSDDVQFFPSGTEFKLSREAAAMKEFAARQQLQRP